MQTLLTQLVPLVTAPAKSVGNNPGPDKSADLAADKDSQAQASAFDKLLARRREAKSDGGDDPAQLQGEEGDDVSAETKAGAATTGGPQGDKSQKPRKDSNEKPAEALAAFVQNASAPVTTATGDATVEKIAAITDVSGAPVLTAEELEALRQALAAAADGKAQLSDTLATSAATDAAKAAQAQAAATQSDVPAAQATTAQADHLVTEALAASAKTAALAQETVATTNKDAGTGPATQATQVAQAIQGIQASPTTGTSAADAAAARMAAEANPSVAAAQENAAQVAEALETPDAQATPQPHASPVAPSMPRVRAAGTSANSETRLPTGLPIRVQGGQVTQQPEPATPKVAPKANLAQAAAPQDSPAPTVQDIAAAAMPAGSDSSSAAGDVSASGPDAIKAVAAPLSTQIAERFQAASGRLGQQIVVRLDPPELGAVHLTMRTENNEIRGVMVVENAATADQIRRETPLLLSHLANNGLDVRRMDVVLAGADTGSAGGFEHSSGRQFQWAQDLGGGGTSDGQSAVTLQEEETPVRGAESGAGGSVNVWV
ncbi:MAG: flagellar hook-length control protein FliK [Phycisphaerae bacterium]|jgi:hypothetical protein